MPLHCRECDHQLFPGQTRCPECGCEGAAFEIFLLKEPVLTGEPVLNAGIPEEISTRRIASKG